MLYDLLSMRLNVIIYLIGLFKVGDYVVIMFMLGIWFSYNRRGEIMVGEIPIFSYVMILLIDVVGYLVLVYCVYCLFFLY